jgi:pimeloyl-ACP methyl ester carboxylesterase
MSSVRAGDLEVAYREAGSGTPALFVHGNWATSFWWEPVLAILPEGIRGIAYDLRGRGATRGPDSDYAIPSLAADLIAFADALSLGRFHLVGHSLGSAVAMEAALARPDRIRSLAVIAPAWVDGMPRAYHNPLAQRAIKDDIARFAHALQPLAPSAPADDFWRRLIEDGHEQRLEAALGNLDALVAWKPGDALAAIAAPKLVIAGALDQLTGGANAERAAAALGARLVVLDGVGHSPNIEAPHRLVAPLAELWG